MLRRREIVGNRPDRNKRKSASLPLARGVRVRGNHLLDALPIPDYGRLFPHLERAAMKLGDVLYEPGVKLPYVYFPTTCIVSLLYVMENGASAEIAIVGNGGIRGGWV